MSIKAIIEIIVYFDSLRNIDLFDKGVYCVRARIQNQVKQSGSNIITKQYAYPYHILKMKNAPLSNLIQSNRIQNHKYKTKSFIIKYIDQQIIIEEGVIFKLEVQTFPEIDLSKIFLYVDLYYSNNYKANTEDLKYGSSIKIKLNNLQKGISNFASFCFEQQYKSIINLYVLSTFMQYKFRIGKMSNIKDWSDYYKFFYEKQGKALNIFYNDYIKQFRILSQFSRQQLKNLMKQNFQHPQRKKLCQYTIQQLQASDYLNQKTNEVQVEDLQFTKYLQCFQFKWNNFNLLRKQLNNIYIDNFMLFQQFIQQFEKNNISKQYLKQQYKRLTKRKNEQRIFKSNVKSDDLANEQLSGLKKHQFANHLRKKLYSTKQQKINLEIFQNQSLPIFFYQITQLQSKAKKPDLKLNSLFVVSHGFQGTSFDMIMIKNILRKIFPSVYILVVKSNAGLTDGDINYMGKRVADEIIQYIHYEQIKQNLIIHMVGHSLGGLILRASLSYLKNYHFGTFISLSVPNLGYLNGTKSSIGMGLWIMKKWKKILSLQQLSMTDHTNIYQTALYKLSLTGSLKLFQHVVLVSSFEDNYVPWHSARIHQYKKQKQENKKNKVQAQMIKNIFSSSESKIEQVHRISISFEKFENNLDGILGRTAHIKFLIDQSILEAILNCIEHLFV